MIRIKEDRERILMLIEMDNITPDEQSELNRLALDVGWTHAKAYADSLEARGATYRYSKEQVDTRLGTRKGIVTRFLNDLFS